MDMVRTDTINAISDERGGTRPLRFIDDVSHTIMAPLHGLKRDKLKMPLVRTLISAIFRFMLYGEVTRNDVKFTVWSKLREAVQDEVVTAHFDDIVAVRLPQTASSSAAEVGKPDVAKLIESVNITGSVTRPDTCADKNTLDQVFGQSHTRHDSITVGLQYSHSS